MAFLNKLSSVAGMLGFVTGLIGFGKIQVLGLMPGFGRLCPSISISCHQGLSDSVVSDFVGLVASGRFRF